VPCGQSASEIKKRPTVRLVGSLDIMPYHYSEQKYGIQLIGWPDGLPFTNLSDVQGGYRTMEMLWERWENGTMRFVQVGRQAAQAVNEISAAPGVAPARKPYVGRSDIKKDRPHLAAIPRRKCRMGPKTPAFVEEEEIASDPIEDADSWSDLE